METFGVGCWSFEARNAESDELESDEEAFARAVLKTLNAIPTVRNATATGFRFGFTAGESDEEIPASPPANFEHVLRRLHFTPHPFTGKITFDIEIPASFSATSSRLALYFPNGDQRFKVEIRYTENFPVVFITTEAGSSRGSNALVVVREFILHELKIRDTPLELKVLGPSPFWSDFTADRGGVTAENEADTIAYERASRRLGYDTIHFTYFADSVSGREILAKVYDYIEPELGLYYQVVSRENRRIAKWGALQGELDSLVELHESNSLGTITKRWATAGRISRRLSLNLLREQAQAADYARRGLEEQQKIYAVTSSRIFKSDLEQRSDLARTDYSAAQSIVTHLDARRRYDVNLAALVVSSTLGGVAGAALTAIVGGG